MKMLAKKISLISLALVSCTILLSCVSKSSRISPMKRDLLAKPSKLVAAPEFSIENIEGSLVNLKDYKGKPIILTFWATWCSPCREEMPVLENVWQKYKDKGLQVLAIAVDRGGKSLVKRRVKDFGISFPVMFEPSGNTRKKYEIFSLPMTYLIEKDGNINSRVVGARNWLDPEGVEIIEGIL